MGEDEQRNERAFAVPAEAREKVNCPAGAREAALGHMKLVRTMGAGFLSYPNTSIRMGMVTTHPMVDNVAPMAA